MLHFTLEDKGPFLHHGGTDETGERKGGEAGRRRNIRSTAYSEKRLIQGGTQRGGTRA